MLTFKGQHTDRRAAWPRRVPWVTMAGFINLSRLSQSLSNVLPRDVRHPQQLPTWPGQNAKPRKPREAEFGGSRWESTHLIPSLPESRSTLGTQRSQLTPAAVLPPLGGAGGEACLKKRRPGRGGGVLGCPRAGCHTRQYGPGSMPLTGTAPGREGAGSSWVCACDTHTTTTKPHKPLGKRGGGGGSSPF